MVSKNFKNLSLFNYVLHMFYVLHNFLMQFQDQVDLAVYFSVYLAVSLLCPQF